MAWLRILPEDNVIIGGQRICRYIGVKSYNTLYRWIELYGLPAVKRPDGQYMTTMTAIDQWIFMYAQTLHDRKEHIRQANVHAREALGRLQRQIEADEQALLADKPAPHNGFAHAMGIAVLHAQQGIGMIENKPHRTTLWRHKQKQKQNQDVYLATQSAPPLRVGGSDEEDTNNAQG